MPNSTASPHGPSLFMTELRSRAPEALTAWYTHILGLFVEFRDEPRGFTLLRAGGSRLAVKQGEGLTGPRDLCRLVFHVEDVDAERGRLSGLGVETSEPTDDPAEPYRSIRLADPEGMPITLFSWREQWIDSPPF